MIEHERIFEKEIEPASNISITASKQPHRTRVIAVTSGKGGVGKTNVVTNLSLALAEAGEQVTILDADFGLANIDVLFGLNPEYHVGHVIFGEKQLEDVIITGPLGVRIIPASSGVQELADLNSVQRRGLIRSLENYYRETGWMLIDTAAGISNNVTQLVRSATEAIVVTTPEPTSIVDAYAIIKVICAESFSKPVGVIVNNTSGLAEAEQVFNQIQSVTRQFLSREIDYLGYVKRDPYVNKAVMRQEPVTLCYPESPASRCFQRIASRMRGGAELNQNGNVLPFWRDMLGISNS